jgi:hypothetical protein
MHPLWPAQARKLESGTPLGVFGARFQVSREFLQRQVDRRCLTACGRMTQQNHTKPARCKLALLTNFV